MTSLKNTINIIYEVNNQRKRKFVGIGKCFCCNFNNADWCTSCIMKAISAAKAEEREFILSTLQEPKRK